jgi:uncharacterized membrane protein
VESQEITDFLKAVQEGIKNGSSQEFRLVSNVEIELAEGWAFHFPSVE